MGWKDEFHKAVKDWLLNSWYGRNLDVVEVTGLESVPESSYYCDTCGPDPEQVLVHYIDSKGTALSATVLMDMAEFMESVGD